MIRVSVDLDSFGLGVKVHSLGKVTITNDGTGTPMRGNYIVRAYSKKGRLIRQGRIENWRRKSKSPLALLSAALQEMGYHKLT